MAATQMVLVYDIERGAIRDQREFHDARSASAEFKKLEREFRGVSDVHVVMLSGESSDAIKATHGSYFREPFFFLKELTPDENHDGH